MSLSYEQANNLRYKLIDVELPEGVDRAMFCALLTAGVRGCLEQEHDVAARANLSDADLRGADLRGLDALEDKRNALKDAAEAVSQAADWNVVAQRIRRRDAAIKSGTFVEVRQ